MSEPGQAATSPRRTNKSKNVSTAGNSAESAAVGNSSSLSAPGEVLGADSATGDASNLSGLMSPGSQQKKRNRQPSAKKNRPQSTPTLPSTGLDSTSTAVSIGDGHNTRVLFMPDDVDGLVFDDHDFSGISGTGIDLNNISTISSMDMTGVLIKQDGAGLDNSLMMDFHQHNASFGSNGVNTSMHELDSSVFPTDADFLVGFEAEAMLEQDMMNCL
jgi:hypothetical protein